MSDWRKAESVFIPSERYRKNWQEVNHWLLTRVPSCAYRTYGAVKENKLRFDFLDPNDAMHFKLAWGGENV